MSVQVDTCYQQAILHALRIDNTEVLARGSVLLILSLAVSLQPFLPPFGACSRVQDHLQQYDVFMKLSIALLYLEKDVIILNNFYNTASA